jgi:hypothetical protein
MASHCNHGWVCEDHTDQPWEHDACRGAGVECCNPDCRKDPDSIFAIVHCSVPKPGTRTRKRSTIATPRDADLQGVAECGLTLLLEYFLQRQAWLPSRTKQCHPCP